MLSPLIIDGAVSLLLVCGGLAIVLSDARARRVAIAGRIRLIALTRSAPVVPAAHAGALMRAPTGEINQSERREIERLCARVGVPAPMATRAYGLTRVVATVAMAFVGFATASMLLKALPVQVHLMGAALGAATGWIGPSMLVRRWAKRHAADAAAGLSEALELLVVCVGAGLSLEDAIDRITGELKWSRPALAEELSLTSADLKILPDRDVALGNLANRIDTPSVRSVVTALSQTLRYGTPLGQALRTTAAELRNDGLLQMEERANRLPTLLTLPMMLFIMPTIFLIIGGPAALKLMDVLAHRR